ncbi:guanylate-binding protein 1-like [Acipenser ruthenus]|uniref:guanylate-binding protein 1-like n=2 Tax=Acipenser ruthenus TaxID=7906 RepID=UPI002741439A|nr:guanylate-binding protein 1-like [Acipenser ruthenus]XP_058866496.1 guanylate-binding protein 1-like [Acipenser ruthenus]XP_058866497.1 guanylate-binding protein 1-like [Acipenser ruthenus]XP_058866498.1 guanylate-binding protein 1-like [Acipenser ruthenus]XP_058866499.1 guanylate-binding protein 1-like [Acipenser ruthenus]XP_058866500.1 guanylate-binding protein 1-like [Acipenser ruthenus]XP_058866501.1 guanylate-binding protein 1-like [Acipenser ruthenus]
MASNTVAMPAPVCLIENSSTGQLHVNQQALEILSQIDQPVVVVAIVGLYRTGKSYLMNKLAGKRSGFSLGSTIQSHTKGIWMWCVPHPCKPGHTLVLLDTEGLGDVEKGDQKNDSWIFALAVLLSSTLVYNSRGTIDNNALENLQYVTELTDLIKVKSQDSASDEEDVHFVRYFPQFIWAVRDFTLELKIEGVCVSADQYLEHALSLKKGFGKKVSDYNLPRECIRRFFPTRRCFVFVAPTAGENMSRVESMEENELSATFLQAAKQFCEYIFTQSTVKTIKGGHKVTGRMLGSLVSTYVDTISSGSVPCLDNAVLAMAQIENKAAVQQGLAVYQKGMEQSVQIPVTRDRISEQHGKWEKQALETFMKRSFKDDGHIHQKTLADQIISHYTELVKRNDAVSIETCNKVLVDLSVQMSHNLQQGVYATPGGYKLYCEDRDHVVQQFRATPNKGTKAEDVLDQFLKQKKIEAASILLADQKLTENEKQIAREREHALQMEQQNKAMEEETHQMKCTLEEERRSRAENERQMELKLQEETENARKEYENALESKLKEQEELMKKGFEEKATMLQEEISQLKQESKIWVDVAKIGLETANNAFNNFLQYKSMGLLLKR